MISCLPQRHWLFSDPNLVCNISLFPSSIGDILFLCPLHFFPSFKCCFLRKPVSSFLLHSEQTGWWQGIGMEFSSNIRSTWMVRRYSAIYLFHFSDQVFLVGLLGSVVWLGNWKLSGVQLIVTESVLMHKKVVIEWKNSIEPHGFTFPSEQIWIEQLD